MSSPAPAPAPATTTSTISATSTPSLPQASASTVLPATTHGDPVSTQAFPPITTHWSRPLSCTWTYIVDSQPQSADAGPIAWLDLEPIPGASTLSCYPDGMFFDGRTGVFSPATCPYGWTTVTVSANTDEPHDEATTTALCCSSEYSFVSGHCERQVPTVLAVPITYNHTATTYEVMTNSTTTLYSATIAVNTIRALFREVDQALLGLTDDSEMIDEAGEAHRALSLGAQIGIGVGVTVFVLLVLGAAIFILLRRKRHRRRHVKGRRSHELDAVHMGHCSSYGTRNPPPGPRTRPAAPGAEPPPAYDAGTETSSLADSESAHTNRDDEIRVLMAQKAAIQRRIEELERVESGEDRDGARNG